MAKRMSKKDVELGKAYEAILNYYLAKEKIKEVTRDNVNKSKQIILKVMELLGVDQICFEDNTESNTQLKASKYDIVKLECIDEEGLYNYLKLNKLHTKVFKRVADLDELQKQFDAGNISLNEVSAFVQNKQSSGFRVSRVNKK